MAFRHEVIAAYIAAIAAVAAVAVAYLGLEDTARQLAATTVYNIAKDGKALQRRFEKGDAKPDDVMSYFFSVYRLRMGNVLSTSMWQPIEVSICNFVRSSAQVRKDWDEHKAEYDKDFRHLIDKLATRSQCE